jgi:hypothetical protein
VEKGNGHRLKLGRPVNRELYISLRLRGKRPACCTDEGLSIELVTGEEVSMAGKSSPKIRPRAFTPVNCRTKANFLTVFLYDIISPCQSQLAPCHACRSC